MTCSVICETSCIVTCFATCLVTCFVVCFVSLLCKLSVNHLCVMQLRHFGVLLLSQKKGEEKKDTRNPANPTLKKRMEREKSVTNWLGEKTLKNKKRMLSMLLSIWMLCQKSWRAEVGCESSINLASSISVPRSLSVSVSPLKVADWVLIGVHFGNGKDGGKSKGVH